jgi:superfamily II DNA/RNA helicase
MDEFRSGSLQILITTDPHVQGVNIREPYLVINYDIPNFENYILRITSVCSSGRKSIVVNFVLKRDLSLIQDIKGILFSTRMSTILTFVPEFCKTEVVEMPSSFAYVLASIMSMCVPE